MRMRIINFNICCIGRGGRITTISCPILQEDAPNIRMERSWMFGQIHKDVEARIKEVHTQLPQQNSDGTPVQLSTANITKKLDM